jgi:hypothetical protein
MNAPEILRLAAQTIEDRAAERGEVSERSMARTIETFNAHWGTELTEQQGWSFMQHLKSARNISGHKDDDLIDKVAYAALEAECVLQGIGKLAQVEQSAAVDFLIAKPEKLEDFVGIPYYIYKDTWKLIRMKGCSLDIPEQLKIDLRVVPMNDSEKPDCFTANWTKVSNFTDLYIPLKAHTLEQAMESYNYLTHHYFQEG